MDKPTFANIFLILFFLATFPLNAKAELFGIQEDKWAHIFAGFSGQVVCQAMANHIFKESTFVSKSVGCFLLVTMVGVAKEITDPSRGGTQDPWDVGAGMLGSGIAIPVISYGFN